jgi:SOS-response transcriptional repressor LexA
MPANDAYRPIIMAPEDLIIEGVFVGLIRDAG